MLKNLWLFLIFSFNLTYAQQVGYKFIENKNQWPDQVSYKADLKSGYLYLEKDGFVVDLYDANMVNKYVRSHYEKSTNFEKNELQCHSYKVEFIGKNIEGFKGDSWP